MSPTTAEHRQPLRVAVSADADVGADVGAGVGAGVSLQTLLPILPKKEAALGCTHPRAHLALPAVAPVALRALRLGRKSLKGWPPTSSSFFNGP